MLIIIERIMEDHEYILNTVLDWSRESENSLVFANRRDKYILFRNPQVSWLSCIVFQYRIVFFQYRILSI